MKIEQLASEALRLSAKDRAVLAEAIWESLEDPYVVSSDISDEEAICLAKLRDDEMEVGKVESLSHQALMDRLKGNES